MATSHRLGSRDGIGMLCNDDESPPQLITSQARSRDGIGMLCDDVDEASTAQLITRLRDTG